MFNNFQSKKLIQLFEISRLNLVPPETRWQVSVISTDRMEWRNLIPCWIVQSYKKPKSIQYFFKKIILFRTENFTIFASLKIIGKF